MSTIAPATARRLASEAAARGATLLDAPVSGGEIGAIDGTLSIMVGGDAAALETVRPILEGMGNPERIIRIGDSGAGQICKACNQLVIGGTLAAVGEAFALARKSGVDPAKVRAALLGGFAASRVLEVHGQRMIDGTSSRDFPARLYHKDLRIVLDTLNEAHAPAPVTAVVQQLLSALMAEGRENDDYSAMGTVLAARLELRRSRIEAARGRRPASRRASRTAMIRRGSTRCRSRRTGADAPVTRMIERSAARRAAPDVTRRGPRAVHVASPTIGQPFAARCTRIWCVRPVISRHRTSDTRVAETASRW